MNHVLTLFYVLVEVGRWQVTDGQTPSIRQAIGMTAHIPILATGNLLMICSPANLQPNFLLFLTRFVASLRWEDYTNVPLTRVCL